VVRALCLATLASLDAFVAGAPARADAPGSVAVAPLAAADGAAIYRRICAGCHMPQGQGAAGAGRYPALAGDPALRSRAYMAVVLLTGRRNMPAFGERHAIAAFGPPVTLTNAQIAAVVNYVRTQFGNRYQDRITAAEVEALDRAQTQ
jgi:mono/diheme cytochrome c family protein